MIDHLEDGGVAESDVLLLEGGNGVVADRIEDELFAGLFDAQVVAVALLLDIVLGNELLAR